ncbi:hypothetical protein CLOP_g22922, partial [Closterium sp. NIES-67]
SNCSLLVFTR